METRTLRVTQKVYDDAQRVLKAAGPLSAMAGAQASQKAAECKEAGDLDGEDHWGAVAALLLGTGGNLSSGVEIIG